MKQVPFNHTGQLVLVIYDEENHRNQQVFVIASRNYNVGY